MFPSPSFPVRIGARGTGGRRARVPEATYFFTVVLAERGGPALVEMLVLATDEAAMIAIHARRLDPPSSP